MLNFFFFILVFFIHFVNTPSLSFPAFFLLVLGKSILLVKRTWLMHSILAKCALQYLHSFYIEVPSVFPVVFHCFLLLLGIIVFEGNKKSFLNLFLLPSFKTKHLLRKYLEKCVKIVTCMKRKCLVIVVLCIIIAIIYHPREYGIVDC